jgi:nucleotide-binding universal stress UspA family protein
MAKQRILVPLDESAFSREVIPHVQRLFGPQGFQLMLLRVALQPAGITADPPRAASSAWTAPLYNSAEDASRARHPIYASQQEASTGAALAGEMLPELHALEQAGYEVSVSVRFGDPAAAIVATAAEEQASLIAMATHGRTGLSHLLLGSVAERVLHRARVPVLLVHPQGIADLSS